MPRCTYRSKVGKAAGGVAMAVVVATGSLVGCAETSLNEAPIIDRSARPGTNLAPVRSAMDDTAVGGGSEAASAWYTVQKGDTLFRISTAFHSSVQDLARWNGIAETAPLTVGQRLRVRAPAVVASSTDTRTLQAPALTSEEAEPVPAEVHAVPLAPSGTVETHALDVVPSGAPATPGNAIGPAAASDTPSTAPASANARLPTNPAPTAAPSTGAGEQPTLSAVAPSSAAATEKPATSVPWIWPVEGRVAGKFDAVHSKGIEIAASEGAKIVAVADGEVSYTGAPRDYGNLVIVRHPDGLLSVYAHTKAILVAQGQTVKRGQALATAGRSDGGAQNVHFEVRRKGVPIDPLELLPAR